MDNVITDFNSQFVRYAKKNGYKIDETKIDENYKTEKCLLNKTDEEADEILESFLADEDFWLTMEPIEGSIEGVNYLNYIHEVVIITVPAKRFQEDCKTSKMIWLTEHLPKIYKVSFNKEKWKEKIDIIIEDKPETLIKCKENGIRSVAIDYKYNRNIDVDYRLFRWAEVYSLNSWIFS